MINPFEWTEWLYDAWLDDQAEKHRIPNMWSAVSSVSYLPAWIYYRLRPLSPDRVAVLTSCGRR